MLVKLIYLDNNLEPTNIYWTKVSKVDYNKVTGLLEIGDSQLDLRPIRINTNDTPVTLYINGALEIIGQQQNKTRPDNVLLG